MSKKIERVCFMTNRKRNLNRIKRRQRAKMVRPSATSTSENYTEEGAELMARSAAWIILIIFMFLAAGLATLLT